MRNLSDVPVVLYGSGFFGFASHGVRRQVNHDQDIEELYKQYMGGDTQDDIRFENAVVESVLRLMFPLRDWVDMQAHNPNLNFPSIEFIKDTLRFIETGRRHTDVQIAATMIDNWSDRPSMSVQQLQDTRYNLTSSVVCSDKELMLAWVSKPGALRDIICTLHTVFGKPISPAFKGF